VASSTPGRGGVARGRGDAKLEYSGETSGRTDQFEAKELDPARVLDPESTAIIGVGAGTPDVAPERGSAGLVESQASTGRASWKRRVAPHHREAVQSFFGSQKQ
jgi:hypothetical protein